MALKKLFLCCLFPNWRYLYRHSQLYKVDGLGLNTQGITILDRTHESSGLPGEITTVALGCCSCAIAQWADGRGTLDKNRYAAEDINEGAVVISEPELDGLLVVPRRHISGLEELSVPARGHILAAIRRAAQTVQERNSGSATSVVVMTGLPASDGHLCFHVVPGASADGFDFNSRRPRDVDLENCSDPRNRSDGN
jgi:diadenosine tetraphosphate (Ap4A) HIT family hydrolase